MHTYVAKAVLTRPGDSAAWLLVVGQVRTQEKVERLAAHEAPVRDPPTTFVSLFFLGRVPRLGLGDGGPVRFLRIVFLSNLRLLV